MKISEILPIDGTAVSTSALAAHKTVIAKVVTGSVEVQASADGVFFCTVAKLTANKSHAVIDVAAAQMRLAAATGNVANARVIAEQGRVRSAIVPSPPTNGPGAPLDIGALGSTSTVYVAKEPGGKIRIQVSADGAHFVDVMDPVSKSDCASFDIPVLFLRAVGQNASGSISVASADPADRALNSPVPTFVFRPGGIAGGNVYSNWESLVEALSSKEGRRILEFDDSAVSPQPCEIPPGEWPMKDVTWAGFGPRSPKGAFRSVVEIREGATFTDLRMIGGQITIQNKASLTPPISDFVPTPPGGPTISNHVNIGLRDDSGTPELQNLGAQPLFDVGSCSVTFFIQNALFGVRSTTPLIRQSGGDCTLVSLGLNQIGENVAEGAAGALVRFAAVSSAAAIGRDQSSIKDNAGLIAYEPTGRIQRRVLPLPPDSPLLANVPIGIPNALVRCDGTNGFDLVLPSIRETRLGAVTSLRIYTGGQEVVIAEVVGGAQLRVLPAANDTIDGTTNPVPIAARGSRTFISDGSSNWITISVVN